MERHFVVVVEGRDVCNGSDQGPYVLTVNKVKAG